MGSENSIQLRRSTFQSPEVDQLQTSVQIALDQIPQSFDAQFEIALNLALSTNATLLLALGGLPPLGAVIAIDRADEDRYTHPAFYDYWWPCDGSTVTWTDSPYYGQTVTAKGYDLNDGLYHLEGVGSDASNGDVLASQNKSHDHNLTDGGHSHTMNSHGHGDTFTAGSSSTDPGGSVSGSTSNHSGHSHSVTGYATADNESSHTHGSSGLSAANESSHNHSYTRPSGSVAAGEGGSTAVSTTTGGTTGPGSAHGHSITGSTDAGSAHGHSITGGTATSGSHNHTWSGSVTGGSHAHTITVYGSVSSATSTMQSATTGITIDSNGGTDARPKSYLITWYKRVR